jgi:cell division protein FtsX
VEGVMKRLFSLFILVLTMASGAQAEINSSGVMGFQAWRTSRIEDAKATLEKIQADAQIDKPQAARPTEAKKNFQRYQQAQLNLQIVQELTISDYFTLYLSQLKDRSMMLDAARKLSADEVADLMVAYQKALTSMTSGSGSDMTLPLLAAPSPQSKPTRLHD